MEEPPSPLRVFERRSTDTKPIMTWAAQVMVIAGPTGQFYPKTLGVVPKPESGEAQPRCWDDCCR